VIALNFIDLFAGCGGMSAGIEAAGFRCLLAVDKSENAIESYNLNRKEKVGRVADLNVLSAEDIKKLVENQPIPLIAAGPPCQGYSLAGKRDVMDERNSMVDRFLDIVRDLQPRYFIMENVVGILSMKRPDGMDMTEWIVARSSSIGYNVVFKKLYAHWYGVGQARPRVVFIGSRFGFPVPSFPHMTHFEIGGKDLYGFEMLQYVTVGQVLASIPPDAPNQETVYDMKRPDYIARVEKLGPGESVYPNFKESHRRLDPAKPAFTMKWNHGAIAIHPVETRMINLREMACLQGFDPYYKFVGDTNEKIAEMIGNAVPVGLARAIALEIKKLLDKME
jgi:DNA (cytosine-5)-methyltransferase 1